MTARVTRRQHLETIDQKFNRLSRRIVRRLPVTAAETTWVWNERSRQVRRYLAEKPIDPIPEKMRKGPVQ